MLQAQKSHPKISTLYHSWEGKKDGMSREEGYTLALYFSSCETTVNSSSLAGLVTTYVTTCKVIEAWTLNHISWKTYQLNKFPFSITSDWLQLKMSPKDECKYAMCETWHHNINKYSAMERWNVWQYLSQRLTKSNYYPSWPDKQSNQIQEANRRWRANSCSYPSNSKNTPLY